LPGATAGSSDQAVQQRLSSGRGELIAKIGTVVSAVMASSCCWLPPLLFVFGVSGAGFATAFEQYRPIFMAVTFGFLAMAFYFTYRRRPQESLHDCCASNVKRRFNMMTLNKIMLWGVTAMAVVFLFFPHLVTGMFAPNSGEFTDDMQRIVVQVDGMTCEG
jgi:hypothetical protein